MNKYWSLSVIGSAAVGKMGDCLRDQPPFVIDAHCHFGTGDGMTGPWDTRASLECYLRRAAVAGIRQTVLFPVFTSDYTRANSEVGRLVLRYPHRFYSFAMVHPVRDRGRVNIMVSEAVRDYGICGIKVHRHDCVLSREICEVAQSLSLPVLYDVMNEHSSIELFATEYPDVSFIIPHMGSFSDHWSSQRAVIDQVARHDNVYADTSGVRRFDLLVELVNRAGAHKVIFGTDGPWLHPGVELAKIQALHLGQDQYELVTRGNFLRLTSQARKSCRSERVT